MPKPFPALAAIHTVAFDFDGVFTDNKVWVDQDGRESVRCDRGDGLAFDLVRAFQKRGKLNAEFFILSKEPNPVVLGRARKLKLDCHHGIGWPQGGVRGKSICDIAANIQKYKSRKKCARLPMVDRTLSVFCFQQELL